MNDISVLIDLYSKMSKHSNYQKLPEDLKKYLNEDTLQIQSRYEDERLAYIVKNVMLKDKVILDIGANTGFFSFELIKAGAKEVCCCEGNKAHADFIKYAAQFINVDDKLRVNNAYFDFSNVPQNITYDIVLLLNVLHHIGDDYGDPLITLKMTKQSIIESLNTFSDKTDIMIFQLGFNWQGDKNKPLFSTGTKQEMIEFIEAGISKKWHILHIGIPVPINNKIAYCDVDAHNIKRMDSLGEFLNRPLFILKSKG